MRERSRTSSLLSALLLLLAGAAASQADVYREGDEEGAVPWFTDAPTGADARLLYREAVPRVAPETDGPDGGELPVKGPITSPYGLRHDPLDGALRRHQGVDIAVPSGTEVRPVAAGRVVYSGLRGGYGNLVIVEHPDGSTSFYAHNLLNTVNEGERVTPADVIALSGSTGRSTGPHLHFELWRGGRNLTARYAATGEGRPAGGPADDPIRMIIQADGGVLLTNVP